VRPIYLSPASGLPLEALASDKKFKLLFVDVGLANKATRTSIHELMNEDITLASRGATAEQFVGQELLAYQDPFLEPQLHFWAREKGNSRAEVDYLITHDSQIIPIEVKAGATGSLKSLHLLMRERNLKLGVRISEKELSFESNILTVPFYLISELPRLIDMYGS